MEKYNLVHLTKEDKEALWLEIKPMLDKFDKALSSIESNVRCLKESITLKQQQN